jgi:hypothetical protein
MASVPKPPPPIDATLTAEMDALEKDIQAIEQRKAGMAAKIPDGCPVLRKRGDEQCFISSRGQLLIRPVYYMEDMTP